MKLKNSGIILLLVASFIAFFIQTLRKPWPIRPRMKQSSEQTLRAYARKPRALSPRLFILGTKAGREKPNETDFQDGSVEKFEFLAKASSNRCGLLGEEIVSSFSDEQRIQGSCCSAMDLHRYQEQVEALKKFAGISQIPKDPYDISAKLAKELLTLQKEVTLSPEEQKIYDEAMGLSHEGGPCCCRCWRWFAFEGLAKYLITEQDFSAEQIAEIWDLEDGCGGAGHAEYR